MIIPIDAIISITVFVNLRSQLVNIISRQKMKCKDILTDLFRLPYKQSKIRGNAPDLDKIMK